jgi:magnesium-transporting ATPase (P-type)
VGRIILEIEAVDDAARVGMTDAYSAFQKVTLAQKARISATCQQNGHAVGFLGDGINVPMARFKC